MTTTATTLPTPAHSVSGSISQPDAVMNDDSPHKRKRALDDDGERDQKKVHLENQGLMIEDLHLDVGSKYLLCQKPHSQQFPQLSADLYEMFSLTGLAAEVAREKPNGEKNALRKTYKGHIKRLGIAGHFDAHKKPDGEVSDFMQMYYMPDDEWTAYQVSGNNIGDGLSEMTLQSLSRATTLAKGPIPKKVWDTSILGDILGDGTKKPTTTPGTPVTGVPAPMSNPKLQVGLGQNQVRPHRTMKKRTYGDSSYEGYNEGYADDDAGAETGYDTGDGDASKRRKKDGGNASPYPNAIRQQYGPGMVGV